MDLRRLTQNTGCRLLRGDALTEITSVCCDSRCAGPGALFVCLPGRHADGHDFAAQAVAAGAAAVLCTHDVPGLPAGCAVLLAGDPRRAMAALAARLYGEPARAMTMIGVTGTKGKTTTAHLLAAVLQADGRRVGLVGTNGVCWPGHRHDLNHTTPESCDLQLLLRRMADDGCDTCVMEVSSLGLKFDRAAEIEFAVGVFTNLSPDHIGPDEHADFAEYLFWKRALFRRCRVGIFNNDDPHVGKIMQGLSCRAVTYGIGCPADVRADADFALTRAGGRLGAAFTVDSARYAVGMPGAFSVYNALAALTAARVLGAGEDAIHAGLAGAV
uniref:Mur ligase family protein n=1 Tax=Gemmiger formicilis TaxID=745368 RepID=UPI00402995C5